MIGLFDRHVGSDVEGHQVVVDRVRDMPLRRHGAVPVVVSRRPCARWTRPTRSSGTVSTISMPSSGSSDGWSLHGHQLSPPSPWPVTPTQGAPDGVSDHTKPSIHGGLQRDLRFAPAYATTTSCRSPASQGSGRCDDNHSLMMLEAAEHPVGLDARRFRGGCRGGFRIDSFRPGSRR